MLVEPQKRKPREPAPETIWGPSETRILYDRFQVLKSTSKRAGRYFSWESFTDFVKGLEEIAPLEYVPTQWRWRFDHSRKGEDGEELGYRFETMVLHRKGDSKKARSAEAREAKRKKFLDPVLLAAELTERLQYDEVDFYAFNGDVDIGSGGCVAEFQQPEF